jgi:hypothetical protein
MDLGESGRGRLHNEELHNLYASTNNIRVTKSQRMREMRSAYKILVGKPEGKRPFRRFGHRWEGVDRMHVARNRDQWQALANMVMNLWVP